jgi:hypothetical protein
MEKSNAQLQQKSSSGDAAVSGLFGGLLGGLAMALVLVLFSLMAGQGAGYLGYFSTATPVAPVQGLLMHLAVSGIYGMLYALLRRWTGLNRSSRVPDWLTGLAYALVLWAVAVTVLLPAAQSRMLSIAWPAFFFGHVAYGLLLGWRQKP